ncbi:hypothetical protein [Evtepia sp.]|uniref:hypothetical protein n=1 Tax=Evtepia sp. TaxID=2773933 RepID=UPI003F149071
MATKNVNILLRLQDKFTKPLQGTTKEIRAQKAQINAATKAINSYADKANTAFKRVTAVAAGVTAALGAAAIKTGFSEALDLEGYRMQLETATKDTKKASEIMQYAINLANKTPFEGGELVEAAASLEMFGLKTERWLPTLGDAASAVNRDISDIQRGFVDAVTTGDFTSLRDTLSITKDMVDEYAKINFGKSFQNAKGQITDLTLLQDSLEGLMQSRFGGGMEKQAKTVRGMWSTVTGVTKNALANILGMQNDGTVKAGSFLDLIREKVGALSERFQQAQADGTIDAIGEKVAKAAEIAGKAMEGIGNAIKWVYDNSNWLIPVLAGVVGGFAAFNILSTIIPLVTTLIGVVRGVAVAGGILNAVMMANPIILIAGLIAILIAAGVALWKNWDTVKAKAQALWTKIKDVFGKIRDTIVGAFDAVKQKIAPVIDWIQTKIDKIKSAFDTVKGVLSSIGFGANSGTNYSIGQKATGTPYFKGGLTHINEGGRGEIVNLPNGTQIIPHDVSKKSVGGSSVVVNLTVQGNVIGNRAFMEQTGDYIVRKIIAAQGVV